MEKFLENLTEAEKILQTADHMIYITFPLIKDKRLLFKILSELNIAVTNIINSILHYEYIQKHISLTNNAKTNFNTFVQNCCPKYNITSEEIMTIKELFDVMEKHKKSSFEFVKNEKIIILSDNLRTETISIEKTKEFLYLGKSLLRKMKDVIRRK
ncbi:MAG: hypothetical protein Q7R52_00600 [archaeon]|nr:hypothetical protein [archaeon]